MSDDIIQDQTGQPAGQPGPAQADPANGNDPSQGPQPQPQDTQAQTQAQPSPVQQSANDLSQQELQRLKNMPTPEAQAQEAMSTHGRIANAAIGLLKGLAMGGIPGAIEGAVSPKTADTTWAARHQMTNLAPDKAKLDAANSIADATLRQAQAANYPAELRQRQYESDARLMEQLVQSGQAEVVGQNASENHEHVLSAAQDAINKGAQFILNPRPGMYVAMKLGPSAVATLPYINASQMVEGVPYISDMQFRNNGLFNAATRTKLFQDAEKKFHPQGGNTSVATLKVLSQYDNYYKQVLDHKPAQMDDETYNFAKQQYGMALESLENTYNAQVQRENDQYKERGQNIPRFTKMTLSNGDEIVVNSAQEAQRDQAARNGTVQPQDQNTPRPINPSSYNDFNKNYVQPARVVERNFQTFESTYQRYKAGQAVGADAAYATAMHLATSLGMVKGAHVGEEQINFHVNNRSVLDSAQAALNKMATGDFLSPTQWDAFHRLITEVRNNNWQMVSDEANRRQFPTQNLLPPDFQGGQGGGQSNVQQSVGHKVGDRITQGNKTFTVTKVDPHGKVLAAH